MMYSHNRTYVFLLNKTEILLRQIFNAAWDAALEGKDKEESFKIMFDSMLSFCKRKEIDSFELCWRDKY